MNQDSAIDVRFTGDGHERFLIDSSDGCSGRRVPKGKALMSDEKELISGSVGSHVGDRI
jgi:hypothetical protein